MRRLGEEVMGFRFSQVLGILSWVWGGDTATNGSERTMTDTIQRAKHRGESNAGEVLDRFWDRGFPVDPVEIANDLGIDVRLAELPENVSGVFVKRPGKDPVIAMEERDSVTRQRFTCAHELAHFILTFGEEGVDRVDRRDGLSAEGTDPEEVYANTFAASLLMPREEVEKLHGKGLPWFTIADHFGVSEDAIRFRLRDLGLEEVVTAPELA